MKNVKKVLIGFGVLSACSLLTLIGVNNSQSNEVKVDAVSTTSNDESDYLTFTALEDSSITINYCTSDNQVWVSYNDEDFATAASGTEYKMNKGDYLKCKGKSITTSESHHFVITGSVNASGSVTSLTDEKGSDPYVELSENCYSYMFAGCKGLKTAPKLPALNLTQRCYSNMFSGCTNLTVAPELPAEDLASRCYEYMFAQTGITVTPNLPSKSMKDACYEYMFFECTHLVTALDLPATELDGCCYSHMFDYCIKLVNAPKLPATNLVFYCYAGMFLDCKSLVYAPALPATKLAEGCYSHMFNKCSELVIMPTLTITSVGDRSCDSMFINCSKLKVYAETTASYTRTITLPSTEAKTAAYDDIFTNTTGDVKSVSSAGGTFYVRDAADYWAESFVSEVTKICDPQGTTDPEELKKVWDPKAVDYGKLSEADQTIIKEATADPSGNNIEKAVHYYDYCTNKYPTYCSKFIEGRTPHDDKPSIVNNMDKELIISIAVITSLVSVSAIGGYFFVKRKKHE